MNYSLRIKIVKFVFPILGIGALALALGVDWGTDEVIAEQFSEEDKAFGENKVTAAAPSVNIETTEGDRYQLSAESVESLENNADLFSGGDVQIDMNVGGNDVKVTSVKAEVLRDQNLAVFTENVVGEIDGKYVISSEKLTADIEKREVTTDERVRVDQADSYVEADSFLLTGPEDNRQITFEGNVSGELFTNGTVLNVASEMLEDEIGAKADE